MWSKLIVIRTAIRTIVLPVIAVGLGALPCSVAARADVIFDFTGTCVLDCSGPASGVLDLSNAYVFGTNITQADFVSLSYTSSDLNFTIPASSDPFLFGGLNADGSTSGFGLVIAADSMLPAFATIDGLFFSDDGLPNFGSALTFTLASGGGSPAPSPAPLPATLPLCLTGLAGLGLLSWRRKRNAGVSLLGMA